MRKNFGAKPFLYPQPVMILGTYDENGKANAMNAAWGGIVGANEIIVDLSAHKTTDNIIKNKAFTVGVADLEHLVACDYVGIVSANKEADKMKKAGFTTTKGEFVNAPIINELPLTLECELVKVIDGSKYLAEIKNVSADEKCLCGYFVLNWLCGCTHCKFCLIYSVSTICIWFLSLYVLCFICTDIIVFGICFAIKLLVRC